MSDQPEAGDDHNMERDNAIRRIEEVEDQLASLVRESKEFAEGSTETPVVGAEEVDQLRQDLTDARADLVNVEIEKMVEMRDEFEDEIEKAEPGDTIVFDEVRGIVKNIEKDNDS